MANRTIADFTQISSLSPNDVALVSSGGVTFKATVEQFSNVAMRGLVRAEFSSLSTLPQTFSNTNITSDMVVFGHYLSNPQAMGSDWTVDTANGSVTVSGTINGTTSLVLYLGRF